ncbi:hypothetical protein SDC9_111741 [bioreactor metagenome]|uniref:Uncharacterized protein n=1 Tax=bioreactor metagenome TaxID=1076179 RepID=A0A645BHB0_9ZZZZ
MRPGALVQQAVEEKRLVVEGKAQNAVFVPRGGKFAHAEIRLHPVFANAYRDVVQMRVSGAPGPKARQRQHRLPPGNGFYFGHGLPAALHRHLYRQPIAACLHRQRHQRIVILRGDADVLHIVLRHTFHPHRFPDAALRCVKQRGILAFFLQLLFAARVRQVLGRVLHAQGQHIAARRKVRRNVKGKRQVAALVAAQQGTVPKYLAFLVHRAKVQQHAALAKAGRKANFFAVMQVFTRLHNMPHPRKQCFGRVRHQNFAVPVVGVFGFGNGVLPRAIEIEVTVTYQVGPWVLLQNVIFLHGFAPLGHQLNHKFHFTCFIMCKLPARLTAGLVGCAALLQPNFLQCL